MVLPPDKDPLGRALIDFCKGKPTPPLIVRSDLAEDDAYEVSYYFREENELPEWERIALSHCKGSILDIGAGSGCHSLILQEQGLPVTAIDISPGAVQVMKYRGIRDVQLTDFFTLSARQFDTLWLMMNGIGIVGTIAGLHQFFNKAPTLLNTNGRIILDSSDLVYLLNDEEVLEYLLNREKAFGEVEFQIVYKEVEGEPFDWLYIDFDSLKQIASKYSFSCHLLCEGPHYEYVAMLELEEI